MTRFLTVVFAALVATSAFSAITYDFTTTSSGISATGMSGVVKSDNGKRRIEITSSDDAIFPAGSVMLANGNTLTVFDPAKKTYYDLDLTKYFQRAAGIGGASMQFSDPKASVTDDHVSETVAGYPAHRQTVQTSFNVTPNLPGLGQQLKVGVQTTTQIWVTDKLPADAANVLQTSRMQTGVPAIDKVVEAMHVSGFPLKQVTTTNVSMNGGDPMTNTSTTVVSNIKTDAKVDASQFVVPAGFTKVADPLASMMKNLALD